MTNKFPIPAGRVERKAANDLPPIHKTPRNKRYLEWMRLQTCCSCGAESHPERPSEAAHVRLGMGGGIGLKPSDYRTVPLCRYCHAEQHAKGERTFWARMEEDRGMGAELVILVHLASYAQDKRCAIELLEQLLEAERG